MKRIFWLTLAAVTLFGCGEPQCKHECEKAKEQLIRDFGVLSVDCNEPKWNTDDCHQCDAIFARDYGVQLAAGGGSCTGFLEPLHTP